MMKDADLRMKRIITLSVLTALSCACSAEPVPAVGLMEQIPVYDDNLKIVARPTYILINQKLDAPAVFSGLGEDEGRISVICCFEVKNIVPLSLKDELKKYARYPAFAEDLEGITGYKYIYSAQAIADKKQWSPLMKTLVSYAADPTDLTPNTVPVIQAKISEHEIPASFQVGGTKIKLKTTYTKNDRVKFTFKIDGRTVEFSQPAEPD